MTNPEKPTEATDDMPMAERIGALVRKHSPQIWNFLHSTDRGDYYLHVDELTETAREKFRTTITDRELTLNGPGSEAVLYYREEAARKLEEMRLDSDELLKLMDLEAIYQKHTLSLSIGEIRVRLGGLAVNNRVESEATILVPVEHEGFLNLRSAFGTLERGIVSIADDPPGMVLKVPGLVAASAIRDAVEGSLPTAPQSGQYL